MIKILIIGDCHLGYTQYNLKEREEDVYKVFEFILQKIERGNYDFVIILGDLIEGYKIKDFKPFSYLSRLCKLCQGKLIYIEGNHDKGLLEVIKPFTFAEGKFFDEGFFLEFEKFNILGFHYQDNHKELRDLILGFKDLIEPDKTILLLHTNIRELMSYLKEDRSISLQDVKDYWLVFNGHIHSYFYKDNFINVGSIETFSVNEIGLKVCLELIIEDKGEVNIKIKEIHLPIRPVLELDNRNELIEILNKVKDRKPIIYYNGNDLLPEDLFLIENKVLYFKKKDIERGIIDKINEINKWQALNNKENIIDFEDIILNLAKEYNLSDIMINTIKDYFREGDIENLRRVVEEIKND